MSRLTYNQKEFVKNASQKDLVAFMLMGTIEARLVAMSNGDKFYRAEIRGVKTDIEDSDRDKVLFHARVWLAEEAKKIGEHTIDEDALGIEGACLGWMRQSEAYRYIITNTVHLWNMCITHMSFCSTGLEDFIEYLQEEPHRSLHVVTPSWINDESLTTDEVKEGLQDYWIQNGFYGMALEILVPVRRHVDENSWTTSGVHYRAWVYGETYEQAVFEAQVYAREKGIADLMRFQAEQQEAEETEQPCLP